MPLILLRVLASEGASPPEIWTIDRRGGATVADRELIYRGGVLLLGWQWRPAPHRDECTMPRANDVDFSSRPGWRAVRRLKTFGGVEP